MTTNYKTFMKHAVKVVEGPSELLKERPVLRGVNHQADGSLAVTDSHRLYFLKEAHEKEAGVFTPGGRAVEGTYPDTSKFISIDPDNIVTYSVADLLTGIEIMLAAAKYAGDKGPTVELIADRFSYEDALKEVTANYKLDADINIPNLYNAIYWKEALQLVKELGYEEVQVSSTGKYRPINIYSKDEKLWVVILPLRRY